MSLLDYLKISFLNLRRQRLRTSLTVMAVVIGAIAVLALVSLGQTVKNVFEAQFKSIGAITQIMVNSQGNGGGGGGPFGEAELEQIGGGKEVLIKQDVMDKIAQMDGVESVTPMMSVWEIQGIKTNDKTYQVRLMGMGLQSKPKLIYGAYFSDEYEHSVVLASSYVKGLGFAEAKDAIGKEVILQSKGGYRGEGTAIQPIKPPEFDNTKKDTGSKQDEYYKRQEQKNNKVMTYLKAKIIGVAAESPGYEGQSFVPIGWANQMNSRIDWDYVEGKFKKRVWDSIKEQGYDSLIIKAGDVRKIKSITNRIKKDIGLNATSVKEMLEEIFKGLSVIQTVLGLIGGIALFVAMIGIINTMFMSIYERTKEIGVMRACGATKKAIRRLFTFEAASIGFAGGAVGVLLILILRFIGNYFLNGVLEDQGMETLNVITIPMWLMIGVVAFTTVLGLLAGFLPAQRAARMDPVEALRYE